MTPPPITATSARPCEAAWRGSSRGTARRASMKLSFTSGDPTVWRITSRYTPVRRSVDEPEQLELGERRRHVAGAEPGPPHDLVGVAAGDIGDDERHGRDGAARARARGSHGRLDPDRLEHVGGARDGNGAEAEQRVRPVRERRGDLARHGEHLAALVEREVGRDQRAAALARLDDDRRAREAGDDPVSGRKPPRRRLDTRRVLGHDQPALGDLGREARVRARVVAVDAAAEHGDVVPPALERPTMRRAVDAAREARDDDDARGGELTAERRSRRAAP